MSPVKDKINAVVLSGGGAYGAYEVGVMKALFTGECPFTGYVPLDANIFTGTSVGSVNAAVMVSQPDNDIRSTIEYLENVWINEISDNAASCGNRVYRFRGDLLRYRDLTCILADPIRPFVETGDDTIFLARDFFRRGINLLMSGGTIEARALEIFDLASFISVEPFEKLLRRIVQLDGIRKSSKVLKIATTDWTTGKVRLFGNEDMVGDDGYCALLGSTAIPGFFPPHYIGDSPLVDGGLVMNTPLRPAIEAGADTIHAIYLDPDVKDIPVLRLQNLLDTFERAFNISFAVRTNEDIETVRWINLGIEVVEKAIAGADLDATDVRDFIRVADQIKRQFEGGSYYKKLTVHRYRPREDLGGALGLLNFNKDRLSALVERGFNDAIYHNCDQSDCVLVND